MREFNSHLWRDKFGPNCLSEFRAGYTPNFQIAWVLAWPYYKFNYLAR